MEPTATPRWLPDLTAMMALGEEIATQLEPGTVLGLEGDLGAGKTTLVRAIAVALGVPADAVSSPTFALCNVYAAESGLQLAHMDLYRLTSEDDVLAAGLDEWLGAPGVIALVEWPAVGAALFPPDTRTLHLALAPTGRLLTIS